MADESDQRRDAIHEFLQSHGVANPDAGGVEGAAVLTGWVVVTEWMDETGEKWLSRGWSSSKAKWEALGMVHEVLYGDWPTGPD